MPAGAERVLAMNSFVRTLGARDRLASLLDCLEASLPSAENSDAPFARASQTERLHCLYGWAGQTLVLDSHSHVTPGTQLAPEDVGEFLGYTPAQWFLSIHIWQPNPGAKGFISVRDLSPNAVVEPPHSHPYDFVSCVSIGEMWQSRYVQSRSHRVEHGAAYEPVDGVWPPHEERRADVLEVVEDRVRLREGDSYYMPRDAIHDVEVDGRRASVTPAITLFLASEAVIKPNAFLSRSMADYHDRTPGLKHTGTALPPDRWRRKLQMVATYLRGEVATLDLSEVVRCQSDYGFFHVGLDRPNPPR